MSVQASLDVAFAAVRDWLQGQQSAPAPESPIDAIAARFGCDPFARNVLLFAAYAALDPDALERASAATGRADITVSTALTCLPGAHWAAFSAEAPLRQARLLDWAAGHALPMQPLYLSEPVLMAALGAPALSSLAAERLREVSANAPLSAPRQQLADRLAQHLRAAPQRAFALTGPDPVGKAQALANAAAQANQRLWQMSGTLLPSALDELVALAAVLSRDLTLTGGRLLLVLDGGQEETAALRRFCTLFTAPIALSGGELPDVPVLNPTRIEMPRPKAVDQAQVWTAGLGKYATRLNGGVAALAQAFPVPPEIAATVAADLDARGAAKAEGDTLDAMAWDAAREAARPRLDDLATRIDGAPDWAHLILPKRTLHTLKALTAQARNRAQVYEDWTFGARLQERGLGITALFAGPSGTGKTLAGEVIAADLGLDLYRVDLSAMVSKWLGETEKNLRRVFDAAETSGAVLQFDEADALFGKRGEVKDAQDRNSNLEVSYLLQRLETYRGLSILTTNLRDNIDEAFLRRLRFIVDFRFPSVAERRAIWASMLPEKVPCAPLDLDVLARLNVAGGAIRNIALGAAFLAAEEGGDVTMDRMKRAALLEYGKTGRILTDAEAAGWDK